MAAPALMPISSGLAMGLPVSLCSRLPAKPSIRPAPAAPSMRGMRHCKTWGSSTQLQPCGPNPNKSASAAAPSSSNAISSNSGCSRCNLGSCVAGCNWGRPAGKRKRGINQSRRGAPSSAVTPPVGSKTLLLPAKYCTPKSVSNNRAAPSKGAHSKRCCRVRAPNKRAIAGAARPIKPITPTLLTTQAVMNTATAKPSNRNLAKDTPRLRAPLSSSSSNRSGRTSQPISSKPAASRGSKKSTPSQLFWLSEPALQINSAASPCGCSNISMTLTAPSSRLTTKPARISVSGDKPRRRAKANTSRVASPPPSNASHSRATSNVGAYRVASANASCAPFATPSVVGEASGLRNTCCINTPANPSAPPHSTAMHRRGNQL